MSFGLDFAWSRPTVAQMKAADVAFICRYLSNDAGKDLSLKEATAASKAGIACVVVWETTANRALSGFTGGKADAQKAAQKAKACGMPDDRPIYFAIDFDANASQQKVIDAYLSGAASVIGKSRVGAYAGFYPLKRAFDNGTITWGWQTYAWSGGKWETRAHIQQYKNGVDFHGADVDYNRSTKPDFGQWKVGESPDMPLTNKDADLIVDRLLERKYNARGHTVGMSLQRSYDGIGDLLAAAGKPVPVDVNEQEIAAAIIASLPADILAELIADKLSDDVARSVLDALRARLET
jgi:hypothetical protein